MKSLPRVIAVSVAAVLSGCTTADFTPYVGEQQRWPTAKGAFVTTINSYDGPGRSGTGKQYTLPVYFGPPNRPYAVLGSVDHAPAAAEAGLGLRPTELIIFGNARGGTPLMQSVQTVGIDLPLKVLFWQNAESKTWLSYNEPSWIAQRHGVANAERVVNGMSAALSGIVRAAADSDLQRN